MKTKDSIIICSAVSIVIVILFVSALLVWLKAENDTLRAKVDSLERDNAKLKETDQSYFNRGVDTLKIANSKASLQSALDTFGQLVTKFPQSSYFHKTQQYMSDIRKRIADMERIETAKAKFESAIGSKSFSEASSALGTLKGNIPDEEHKALCIRLYEEQNKPLETTINKLVSEFGSYKYRWDTQNAYGMLNKRVRVGATFTSVDRYRKELRACSDGWGEGSTIRVFYEGTNMENDFTNNDPKCCNNRYIVTGITKMYSNVAELYIKAEKIDVIRYY